jgi:hypothetical protein
VTGASGAHRSHGAAACLWSQWYSGPFDVITNPCSWDNECEQFRKQDGDDSEPGHSSGHVASPASHPA